MLVRTLVETGSLYADVHSRLLGAYVKSMMPLDATACAKSSQWAFRRSCSGRSALAASWRS